MRRCTRGLHDGRVAGHERGDGEADDLPHREVPRHDGTEDPAGIERDVRLHRLRFNGLGIKEPRALLREDVRGPRALVDLRVRFADDLSHLQRHRAGVVVAVLAEDFREVGKVGGAVGRGEAGPGAECDAGLFDGGTDLPRGRDRMAR